MSRNIVILNGSPRRRGNTSRLVEAFTKGAEEKGNRVTEFFLQGMDLHPCLGCGGGHSDKEMPCVQKDDMAAIYPKLKEADVVVLASPLYYWNISGQLKLTIDRMFALEEGDTPMLRGGKACLLLMPAEGSDFEDMQVYFDHLMEHLEWENLGMVFAGGNGGAGDIDGKPELEQAYALGASIG